MELGGRRDPSLLHLALSFTGYLLPWDQIAFWAVNVGSSMAAYAPMVSTESAFVIFAGIDIGPDTLIRFYVYHVIAFPLSPPSLWPSTSGGSAKTAASADPFEGG